MTKEKVEEMFPMAESGLVHTFEVGGDKMAAVFNVDTNSIFDHEESESVGVLEERGQKRIEYIKWGVDNRYPYELINLIKKDEVLGPNKLFNVQACYGNGIHYVDKDTKLPTTNQAVIDFIQQNNIPRFELERITDSKFFYFDIVVFILNKERTKIVSMRPKEAAHIRFAKADKSGKIPYVYSANWDKQGLSPADVEAIPLLDEWNPLGDLRAQLGLDYGADGEKFPRSKSYKFAILSKFPTAGNRYYPDPYSMGFLFSTWYKIKKLIPIGKLAKMKNLTSIRYVVEINTTYWTRLFQNLMITDRAKQKEAQEEKMREIETFVSGAENSGKMWVSTFFVDPISGKEVSDIKITVLDTKKEGGDWSEDAEEANNMACYADGVHPNLIGATPGKSKMNNSGSDKRELFTMKQYMEKAFHDIMLLPHQVLCAFNNWNDVVPTHPIITLTTLDKGKDAEIKTTEI